MASTRKYKDIAAYHVATFLWFTDYCILFPVISYFRHKTAASLTLTYQEGQRKQIEEDIRHGAVFLTNHRDIVLDAAFLSYKLRLRYNIRPFMGIGNNLFGKKWIEPIVRYNRCFVVKRDGGPRDAMEHAQHMSEYLAYIRQHKRSIWLAQREGRAKDSNDLTQPAVLKMLTIHQEDFLKGIRDLNICPVSLNYEYDPCDYLKAQEMQLKRDNPHYRKTKQDDVLSMKTGINGYKGEVVFRMTPSINHWLDQHEDELKNLSRNEQAAIVAAQIDKQIHSNYQIYERGEKFEQYLQGQLEKIDIPNKDEEFLMSKLREMYNNPVINYEKSHLPGIV